MAKGRKDDRKDGKLMYELIPPESLKALATILTFGAKKYDANNWQGVETERYYAALMRHVEAWRMGENIDSESGEHHLSHALCNVMFIQWLTKDDK